MAQALNVAEHGSHNAGVLKIGALQIGAGEICLFELTAGQVRLAQVGVVEVCLNEFQAIKVGARQVGVLEVQRAVAVGVDARQGAAREVRTTKMRYADMTLREIEAIGGHDARYRFYGLEEYRVYRARMTRWKYAASCLGISVPTDPLEDRWDPDPRGLEMKQGTAMRWIVELEAHCDAFRKDQKEISRKLTHRQMLSQKRILAGLKLRANGVSSKETAEQLNGQKRFDNLPDASPELVDTWRKRYVIVNGELRHR